MIRRLSDCEWPERYHPLVAALDEILDGGTGETLVHVLKSYQNSDGGFGHGLEADIQMPGSNVASTDMAFNLLRFVSSPTKLPMIQSAIEYYCKVYDATSKSFEIVPPEVDRYPHAIWWNYDGIAAFTYGNPNPEIAGTLLAYREYVKDIELDDFISSVLHYIEQDMATALSMHSLMSSLWLYQRSTPDIKTRLHNVLQGYIDRELAVDPSEWEQYGLEPYKVFLIAPEFLGPHQSALASNITSLIKRLNHGPMEPNWTWHQYEDVFQTVRPQWTILSTFDALWAIKQFEHRKQ